MAKRDDLDLSRKRASELNRGAVVRRGSMKRQWRRCASAEQLETRSLLTAVTAAWDGTTLSIDGSGSGEGILVSTASGVVTVTDFGIGVTITGGPPAPSDVKAIDIFGDGGTDNINLWDVDTGHGFNAALSGDITIDGGSGTDFIYGSEFGDSIYGGDGNYSDHIYGDKGADWIQGGDGGDWIVGEEGNDILFGEAGQDTIYGDAYPTSITTASGNDWLIGGDDNDTLDGGVFDDVLVGDNVDVNFDPYEGDFDGNDSLFGGNSLTISSITYAGNDDLYGLDGSDTLDGGDGTDFLAGGSYKDTLKGGAGVDTLFGDEGRDSLLGGNGADSLSGGDGCDTLNGESDNDQLYGDAGDDSISDTTFTAAVGGTGRDTVNGLDDGDARETCAALFAAVAGDNDAPCAPARKGTSSGGSPVWGPEPAGESLLPEVDNGYLRYGDELINIRFLWDLDRQDRRMYLRSRGLTLEHVKIAEELIDASRPGLRH